MGRQFLMKTQLICLSAAFILVLRTNAYQHFRNRIPNGMNVPNPCKSNCANCIWNGVGHWDKNGGGARNPFGQDFDDAGQLRVQTWKDTLCRMDSDGDGRSNGVELGDPSCTWQEGDQASRQATSHPGICEPVHTDRCRRLNGPNVCQEFDCRGATGPGVDSQIIQLTQTVVPAWETTYYCQIFDLPSDKTYDVVAAKPEVKSTVLHHMLLYGCVDEYGELQEMFQSPRTCSEILTMGPCHQILAGWVPGNTGDCYDGLPAAVRIGKGHFNKVLLEVHWDNPKRETYHQDNSGFTLYYSDRLRPNALAVLTLGQLGLKMPPNERSWTETSKCSSSCTEHHLRTPGPIRIVSAGLHMHGKGRAAEVYLHKAKNGPVIKLVDEKKFSLIVPTDYSLSQDNIMMEPGDEITFRCTFDTSGETEYIYYGEGTREEMCYAFITYYNKTRFSQCIQMGSEDLCSANPVEKMWEAACVSVVYPWSRLEQALARWVFDVVANCRKESCTSECRQTLKGLPKNLPQGLPRGRGSSKRLNLEWILSQCEFNTWADLKGRTDIPDLKDFDRRCRSCDRQLWKQQFINE